MPKPTFTDEILTFLRAHYADEDFSKNDLSKMKTAHRIERWTYSNSLKRMCAAGLIHQVGRGENCTLSRGAATILYRLGDGKKDTLAGIRIQRFTLQLGQSNERGIVC